jgi:hypothetical protein
MGKRSTKGRNEELVNYKTTGDKTMEGKEEEEGKKKWQLGPEMGSYQLGSVRAAVSNFWG